MQFVAVVVLLEQPLTNCPRLLSPYRTSWMSTRLPLVVIASCRGVKCFEGMKAYKDAAGNVRLFRPELNIRRFNRSMARLHFPTVDEGVMIQLLR